MMANFNLHFWKEHRMNYNFYIVEDDPSVQRILSKIITGHNLGDIAGSSLNGEDALTDIGKLKPDIVLVDLLLPKIDGITLVSQLKPRFLNTPFIMISEVYAKEMVSKAYDCGVEYYINKPINVNEVLNVIKRVDEKLKMQKVINSFQSAFASMNALEQNPLTPVEMNAQNLQALRDIYSHLGILSEVGTKDLTAIVEFILGQDDGVRRKILDYRLTDLYAYVSNKYEREKGEFVNEKTIEQRIRRALNAALTHIAELGLEDYSHIYFERYSDIFFDFREIRKEMSFVKGKEQEKGRINIKKFIAGLILEVNRLEREG
jgi:two-component system response regulator YcbB